MTHKLKMDEYLDVLSPKYDIEHHMSTVENAIRVNKIQMNKSRRRLKLAKQEKSALLRRAGVRTSKQFNKKYR